METPLESPLLSELETDLTISDNGPNSSKRFSVYLKLFLVLTSTIIFFLGITVLCGWLWYYPQISPPTISLEKFYVPGLDKASNDTKIINATSISFELCFSYFSSADERFKRRIYYDNVKLDFYYYSTDSIILIGNISLTAFRQNPYSSLGLYRAETIETFGVHWDEIRTKFLNGGTAMFRIDLDTKFEYSTGFWKPNLRLGANVTVNDHGMKSVKYLPLKPV